MAIKSDDMFLRSKIKVIFISIVSYRDTFNWKWDVSVLLAFPRLVKFKEVKISTFLSKICLQRHKFERQAIRAKREGNRERTGRQRKTEALNGDAYMYLMERCKNRSTCLYWFLSNTNVENSQLTILKLEGTHWPHGLGQWIKSQQLE